MRTFPPLTSASSLPRILQVCLLGLVLQAGAARADVYGDVERMIRNGQLERALQASNQHLGNNPQDPQMRLLVSRILDAQGQAEQAMGMLESLTLEFPELPEPHNNLAVMYARLGRIKEALQSLDKALLVRPDYGIALENLGDLHLSLALNAYQRASQAPTPAPSALRKASALAPVLQR